MPAATGYYLPGDSWLHRRNPLTKLLALGWVLLAAFLLPPWVLPILIVVVVVDCLVGGDPVATWSARCASRPSCSCRSSSSTRSSSRAPPTRSSGSALRVTREGLTFGLISAGRVLVAFLASVTFLFRRSPTTCSSRSLPGARATGSRSSCCPRSRWSLDSRRAPVRSSRRNRLAACPSTGSIGTRIRALLPLVGPVLLGSLIDVRERTFALEARGFGARPDRTAYRVVPIHRWTAWLGSR